MDHLSQLNVTLLLHHTGGRLRHGRLALANATSINGFDQNTGLKMSVLFGLVSYLLSSCDCHAGSRRMWSSLEPNPKSVSLRRQRLVVSHDSVHVIC